MVDSVNEGQVNKHMIRLIRVDYPSPHIELRTHHIRIPTTQSRARMAKTRHARRQILTERLARQQSSEFRRFLLPLDASVDSVLVVVVVPPPSLTNATASPIFN